ncbi:hypothetical protein G8770_20825 [Aestuariicella hydrocarbonica]|uniref:Uncharacterized protein n=1 Tax=Pseudomaricurvus hydrocarbonicus TaxID=1470433 RepID=A0A9E5T4I5_9GAMM|nr:hypothetical protein [Aestuariicella hydrocarbonica]NHO67999.1 hypothetical protein [Aestuariicella hydrocarbonica]
MYVFSASAVATKALDGIEPGQKAPFIVYINFLDLFGAETLCKILIMREGFKEVEIEKRQLLTPEKCKDPKILNADKGLREALKTGFAIQLFSE